MVLLLLDWENIWLSLVGLGPKDMNLDKRIEKLMEWVREELGGIWGGYGFVFAPSHLLAYHQQICDKNGLRIIICPKDGTRDTVDETIIWFGKMMMRDPIKTICLASGDSDYIDLLEEAKKRDVNVALIVPTLGSISGDKVMINLADNHPQTGQRMILRLDNILEKRAKKV